MASNIFDNFNLVEHLNHLQRELLLKQLIAEKIKVDVFMFLHNERGIKLSDFNDLIINFIVERIVYDDEYDLEVSYWKNVQNIRDDVIKHFEL